MGQNGGVPDVSQPETQLWFYFLAASYIDLGFEGIHWGQVEIMDHNDPISTTMPGSLAYPALMPKSMRAVAWFCAMAHVPSGGLVRDGQLLLDFHAFP